MFNFKMLNDKAGDFFSHVQYISIDLISGDVYYKLCIPKENEIIIWLSNTDVLQYLDLSQ